MVIIAVVGAVYFLIARPDRKVAGTFTTSWSPRERTATAERGLVSREWEANRQTSTTPSTG